MRKVVKRQTRITLVALAIWLGCAGAMPARALELIASKDVPVDTLSVKELRAMFAMRRGNWPDGSPVKLFVLPNNSVLHRQFCKQLLSVFPHQLQSRWDKLLYSGRGTPPEQVEDVNAMINAIAKTPGAIGYVDQLPAMDTIKVITVSSQ